MSIGTTLTFHLPESWSLRKLATAMVREWLPSFRAEPTGRAARWVVQFVMDDPAKGETPLWEPGISTQEYEERLDRIDLSWAIRASAGRGKGIILARLTMGEQPATFHLECPQFAFPEALFDSEKVDEFLRAQGTAGTEGFFAALLSNNGFRRV